MQNYDVAIIGAGIIGLTAALALQNTDLRVVVIDSEPADQPLSQDPELRVSAINLASQNIFCNLGAWQGICEQRLQAYQHMQVWEQDSFAKIDFWASDIQQTHLGSIIENQAIRLGLMQQLKQVANVEIAASAKIANISIGQSESFISLENGNHVSSKLVVGADGANSLVRKVANLPLTFWDYDQIAIVATIETEFAHENVARQVFTPDGPLALLPLYEKNLCSIVWSQRVEKAESLLKLDDRAFNHALSAASDTRLGQVKLVSKRASYPLKMRYCRKWVSDRIVLIGDAAHTIHPLAGQGANLGIADAAALAEVLVELQQQNKDIGLAKNLRSFERWRKSEALQMIAVMESFKRLFSGANPVKKLIRDIGLSATNQLSPLKNDIIKQAVGIEGNLPKLANIDTSLDSAS
ncbi:FAD-dependent oxidoreductase [Aliiglaciecola lipolytica]|uniref:FAD-dependent oxidoreductase n=1 Tax=Aliiglaciecola lipolytica TaxID=477689 RepID=UPI001C0A6393|nr:FAD-dependent oxidoreductase [Aliiglaciecola lipolytica]MBU2876896.1 FAD-dependent monooxygenase [Aliiglaciecola lipolytica]